MTEAEILAEKINKKKKNFKGQWSNFKITFHLSSPITITHPFLNLDSVIQHMLMLENLDRDYFITDKKQNLSELLVASKPPFAGIVSKKHEITLNAVSTAIIEDDVEYRTETIFKRFEDRFLGDGQIRVGSGLFKAYAIKHIYIPASKVSFYITGVKDAIVEILERNLFGIGDNVRIGYGWIRKIEVEDTDDCYSVVKDGLAMRPIPVEMAIEYEEAVPMPYRPPYWDKKNVRLCVPPFSKVKLKKPYREFMKTFLGWKGEV